MSFRIVSPDLQTLDLNVVELNKRYGMILHSLNNFTNTYAAQEMIKNIEALKRRLESLKVSGFDLLVQKNHLANLEVQRVYLEYFATRTKENTEQMFSKVLGKDALKIIKDNIKSIDYKKMWEYYCSYQEYTYRQIPSDDESLRPRLKDILVQLKQDTLAYGEEKFNFSKDYTFDLILSQPYSTRTFFHPTTKRMEVSPNTFFVFHDDGEVKINVCGVIEALFHELLGHGRHEFNSRSMPPGLQDNGVNITVPTSHVHAEGVSQTTKHISLDFMRKYQKKYNIEEEYIRQRELSVSSEATVNFWVYFNYLKLQSFEKKKIDVEKEFLSLTNNYGLFLIYSTSEHSSLSCVKDATYPIGLKYMNDLLEKLKKELGEKSFAQQHARIYEAIATGVWHYSVLPQFVKMFLEEKD
ncbi:hypothetical protein FJZ18_01485 [Candidatus Pacearchaeota archaeon]|nr:hypothetical protein [Candidatus Pacearchaeota archaeon]